jgi:DNA-binding transcriptional ArsR family regulator
LHFVFRRSIFRRMVRPKADADVFRAIADPTRRALLDHLSVRPATVTALTKRRGLSMSSISQHLKVLRESGLVAEEREGRRRRYHVVPHPLREVSRWMQRYERFWNEKLDALGRRLDEDPS